MIDFSTPSADGTNLSGRHWAADTPKAVMALVHGFGEYSGRYSHMATYLNANDISVVAVDFHGHGKTDGPRGVIKSYADFQNDLTALLAKTRNLYPDIPVVLYGHSMGGGIVLDHGLRELDNLPIIASAPFIHPAQPIPKLMRVVVKTLCAVFSKGSIKQPIDGAKISNLPKEQEAYLADPLNHGTLGFKLAEGMVETGENIGAKAADWDRPLLLLHSKSDQLTSYHASDEFGQTAKQVEFHSFDIVQHEMHNDKSRGEVYDLMLDFIRKQTKTDTA